MSPPLVARVVVVVLAALVGRGASHGPGPMAPQSALASWADAAAASVPQEGLIEDDTVSNAIGFEATQNSKRSSHSQRSQSTDLSSILNAYRGNGQPVCSCQASHEIRDLGHLRFPRYIRFFTCKATPCWRPPYVCKQRYYRVPILAKRTEAEDEDDPGNAAEEDILPESLRRHWKMDFTMVPVACECAIS